MESTVRGEMRPCAHGEWLFIAAPVEIQLFRDSWTIARLASLFAGALAIAIMLPGATQRTVRGCHLSPEHDIG